MPPMSVTFGRESLVFHPSDLVNALNEGIISTKEYAELSVYLYTGRVPKV
jgi:hypothetical protein